MPNYVLEFVKVWSESGEEAAHKVGDDLLRRIDEEHRELRREATALRALLAYLHSDGSEGTSASDGDPSLDIIEAPQRSRLITEAATEVLNRLPEDENLIKGQDVLDQLRQDGLDLGVQQPFAVIGTVLNSANGFTKIARNTFEYKPPPTEDDLPW